jgi:CelD/BcsL family acetyltransferase involved in cellulose biosynthesis
MAAGIWNIKFITNWNEVYSKSFQDQWNYWIENAVNSHVFMHPSLCMAWLEAYRLIRNIHPFFIIASNENFKAFLPLLINNKNWKSSNLKVAEPLGFGDFDYHDPLFIGNADQELINSFWDHITSIINGILLKRVDKVIISGIRNKGMGEFWLEDSQLCPFKEIRLMRSENELLNSLSTRMRGDIRRQLKRLERIGSLKLFEYNFEDLFARSHDLDNFLNAHITRWPNSYKAPDFHRLLLARSLPSGVGHFSELRLNDQVISWHLGFKWKKRYYYYMPAICKEFNAFSPGKLHLYKLIARNIENGFEIFDFLRGQEDYKNQWTRDRGKLYNFEINSGRAASKVRIFLASYVKTFVHLKRDIVKKHLEN